MKLFYLSSGPRESILKRIVNDGHTVLGVITTDPVQWPKVQPTIELAHRLGIPHQVISRSDLHTPPAALSGQICFSSGFGLILPRTFLDHVSVCLNVHGALLPKYRGNGTLNWALVNGERKSGVTVHVIDAGIDTGPIVLQRAFSLSPFETAVSLCRKTREFEPDVVSDALRLFEREGVRCLKSQADEPQFVPYPDRCPEHSRIDPTRSLLDLVNEIRASDPDHFPAYFMHFGEKVCVKLWRPDRPEGEKDLL